MTGFQKVNDFLTSITRQSQILCEECWIGSLIRM